MRACRAGGRLCPPRTPFSRARGSDDVEEHQVALELGRREAAAEPAGTVEQHLLLSHEALRLALDGDEAAVGALIEQHEALGAALDARMLTRGARIHDRDV